MGHSLNRQRLREVNGSLFLNAYNKQDDQVGPDGVFVNCTTYCSLLFIKCSMFLLVCYMFVMVVYS